MPLAFRETVTALDRTFRSKPLVILAAAWVAGILLADRASLAPGFATGLGLLIALAALGVGRRRVALGLLLVGLGWLAVGATGRAIIPPRGDISAWSGRQVAVVGTLDGEPSRACESWRGTLAVQTVHFGGQAFSAEGRLSFHTAQDLGALEPGDRLLLYGVAELPSPARNPGGFSRQAWLARQGIFATLSVRRGAVMRLSGGAPVWRRWAGRLRHRIAVANRRAIADPEAAALVNSLLFGDLDQDDPRQWGATEERFRRAGLSHVLVVSGAQIALLFGLVPLLRHWALGGLSRRTRGRLRWLGGYSSRQALGIGMVLLTLYVLLAGLSPSVLRAALIAGFFFGARWLDRETDAENSLAAAALVLLVANPLTLYDVGFQLSFAATWAIVRGSDPLAGALGLRRRTRPEDSLGGTQVAMPWGFLPQPVGTVLAASLAAILATAPLTMQQFGLFSLVSPVANIPVCLMATLLLPLGLVSSLLSVVLTAAGLARPLLHGLNVPTELSAQAINTTVAWFASPDWALVPVSPPGWPAVAVYLGLLLAATLPAVARRRSAVLGLTAVAVAFLCCSVEWPAPNVAVPTFTFIDVGQGDACLVRLPGGATMLVDGGGSPRAPCGQRDCGDAPVGRLADAIRPDCLDVGRDILASFLRHERVRRIDLVVLSHPHDDHLWGLDAVLDPREGFAVGAVLDAVRPLATPASREWYALLQRRGLTPIIGRRGMRLVLGPARLAVLHPPEPLLRGTRGDENNNSVVLRLEVHGRRILLAGDAGAAAEAAMAGEDVGAELLKVGHHGSAFSTDDAWLARVRPRIAVISCGAHNLFGHPSRATLERLRRHGVRVFRTDRDGAVSLEMTPSGWTARTMNGGAERVTVRPG